MPWSLRRLSVKRRGWDWSSSCKSELQKQLQHAVWYISTYRYCNSKYVCTLLCANVDPDFEPLVVCRRRRCGSACSWMRTGLFNWKRTFHTSRVVSRAQSSNYRRKQTKFNRLHPVSSTPFDLVTDGRQTHGSRALARVCRVQLIPACSQHRSRNHPQLLLCLPLAATRKAQISLDLARPCRVAGRPSGPTFQLLDFMTVRIRFGSN